MRADDKNFTHVVYSDESNMRWYGIRNEALDRIFYVRFLITSPHDLTEYEILIPDSGLRYRAKFSPLSSSLTPSEGVPAHFEIYQWKAGRWSLDRRGGAKRSELAVWALAKEHAIHFDPDRFCSALHALNSAYMSSMGLTGSSGRPLLAARLTDLAALLAADPNAEEAWRWDLLELATTGTRRRVLTYAAGLLWASMESRCAWLAKRATVPFCRLLCWILCSEFRTWTPLLAILLWGGIETIGDTGLGAAILLVLTGGLGLHALVEWARKRFNSEVRPRKREAPRDST
ncbi:hypothetical protein [Nonomuraea sp. NPDC049141]|uniref:hypothetical protein n=1 Tax=Nonomuraea sp. NPDC049141 TaxID=3155500 RepID=UPI0033D282CC